MLCSIRIILFHYPWKAPEGERIVEFWSFLKPRAKGRNIVGCYILRPFAHPVARCVELSGVVAQNLKPVKLMSQQLPTFLLFRDRRSVAQKC